MVKKLSFVFACLLVAGITTAQPHTYSTLVALSKTLRQLERTSLANGVPDYRAATIVKIQQSLAQLRSQHARLDTTGWPLEQKVDYVIHLGDFINPNSIREFREIKLIAIFGNNDGDKLRLIGAFHEIGGEIKSDFYEFEADNLKFAYYHGTESHIVDALITCQKYDVFLYGHTHQCVNITVKKTMVLNPGTAHGFEVRATIMIFDTKTKHADLFVL